MTLLRPLLAAACVTALAGCLEDRDRPQPTEPSTQARLSVLVNAPRSGTTVPAGQDVAVTILARDLEASALQGVGYVARRLPTGTTIDSATVRFLPQRDSTHSFAFRVPAEYPTSTQIEILGIAFGPGAQSRLSTASTVFVVRCVNGVCQ